MSRVALSVLQEKNTTTTNAIITAFESNDKFLQVAEAETKAIVDRDEQDNEKLNNGIKAAIEKGVLEADIEVEPVVKVNVLGKSATDIAEEIIGATGDSDSGKILVIQGLSGTGKGTVVSTLKSILPNAVTWSNGNIFRSITLLAATHCEQTNQDLTDDVLTPDLFAKIMTMLEFNQFDGKFDTKIEGFGVKHMVSEVENSILKSAKVSKNIPMVANYTQGEVVKFANDAVKLMGAAGVNVLVEGREATLNYVRTPHRFELVLEDLQLIGKRRLAQKMMGGVLAADDKPNNDDDVEAALTAQLETIAASWKL